MEEAWTTEIATNTAEHQTSLLLWTLQNTKHRYCCEQCRTSSAFLLVRIATLRKVGLRVRRSDQRAQQLSFLMPGSERLCLSRRETMVDVHSKTHVYCTRSWRQQASLNTEYRGHKEAVFGTCPPLGRLLSLKLPQISTTHFCSSTVWRNIPQIVWNADMNTWNIDIMRTTTVK
jgi:hypothetical protein